MNTSPKDIIELIEACKRHGISDFKCDGLEFNFGIKATQPEPPKFHPADPIADKHNLEELELLEKQSHLDELRLRDPLAYEEAVTQDDLVMENSVG